MIDNITERKRAEEELLKISTAVEQTADCVVITDKNGIIQYVNTAFTKIFGYSKEEAIGKTPRILKSKLHPPEFYKVLWDTILSGEVFSETFFNRRKDGEIIYEIKTITPIKDKEGNIKYFVSTAKEITEQRRAEEMLRKSEAKFRKLINSLPDAVLVVNTEGQIVYCNENATKIFDYNQDEMLTFTVEDLIPKRFKERHLAFRNEYLSEPKGRPMGNGKELFALRKNGSEFPVEIMLEPVEIDKELHVLTIVRDISERKRAEEEIISQKNRFSQLFENSPYPIVILNDQNKVIQINESFTSLFGFYLKEIAGHNIDELLVPSELKEEAEIYSNETLSGNPINKESYRKKKDGALVYVQVLGIPIVINEKVVGIYGVYVDLTQRKEAEDKMKLAKELAEHSDRLKSEFLAQMSHEIRTPLNVISGNVDYLNNSFGEKMEEDVCDCFEGIELASKRIIRTIDLILNVAELQTTGYKPYLKEIDLNTEVLNKLYLEHQLSAKQKGLELIYKCVLKEIKILADEYSITQIFANLIDNAIKYTKKGKVEILLEKNKKGNVMVEIKDTGIGMSKEFLPRIFEPFVQEEQGYTRGYEGNGLGLALTKKYCEVNNAVLEVESEKNIGSTFRIIFSKKN